MPRALRYLFLAAVLLIAFGLPLSAAVVTGSNVQRYYKDGSGGYDYERMLAGSNAGAIDTLVTDGSGHLVVSTTGTGAVSGTVTAVGGAASGAAVSGNPVLMAGSDGVNARTILTDSSGRRITVGAAAAGSAISGNPVLVGASDGTNAQTLKVDSSGNLKVGILSTAVQPTTLSLPNTTDGSVQGAVNGMSVLSEPTLFDGGTQFWRQRGNTDLSLLASSARTTATNSPDQTNYNGRGCKVVISVTAASGTGGLTISVQGKDSISASYYTLLSSAALTSTGVTVLTVYPGVTTAANASVADVLPRTWRVSVAVGDASSYTYSISGVTIN